MSGNAVKQHRTIEAVDFHIRRSSEGFVHGATKSAPISTISWSRSGRNSADACPYESYDGRQSPASSCPEVPEPGQHLLAEEGEVGDRLLVAQQATLTHHQ